MKIGARNIYTCEKFFSHIVTQDCDEGVTPFMVMCKVPNCRGHMQSSFYRVWDQRMRASWEWYKPPVTQILGDREREHVEKCGLLMREATSYLEPPPRDIL